METSAFASSPLHGDPVISRKTHWVSFRFYISRDTLGSRSVLYLTKQTNSWASLVHEESTSTLSWCSTTARLHGPFVTVKTQASSRLSGHRARVILLQSIIIALYFGVFFASGAARARSFCTHQRSRITESTFFSASITKIDGSGSSSSGWRCTTARQAMCALVQDTSARSLFVFVCRRSETSTFWLVQSRRRPEKWTRTRKADSRGSATPDPVS